MDSMLSKADPKVRGAFERLLDRLGRDYSVEHIDSATMEKAILASSLLLAITPILSSEFA